MSALKCSRCRPVLWRHADGWDVYPGAECSAAPDGTLVPRWFDGYIVEDAPTRAVAVAEWCGWHVLGQCLVPAHLVGEAA